MLVEVNDNTITITANGRSGKVVIEKLLQQSLFGAPQEEQRYWAVVGSVKRGFISLSEAVRFVENKIN